MQAAKPASKAQCFGERVPKKIASSSGSSRSGNRSRGSSRSGSCGRSGSDRSASGSSGGSSSSSSNISYRIFQRIHIVEYN